MNLSICFYRVVSRWRTLDVIYTCNDLINPSNKQKNCNSLRCEPQPHPHPQPRGFDSGGTRVHSTPPSKKMMTTSTTTGFNPSLLKFSSITTSSSSLLEFKSPASHLNRKISAFKSGGKVTETVSSTTIIAENPTDRDELVYMCRRRALLLTATVPFVLPLYKSTEGFGANATEVVMDESSVIREGIRKVMSKGKAPGVLRLVFHDAGTFDIKENSGGMNGSIVYELERPENAGLKKSVKILEKAKGEVDGTQPVSWADIVAVAGAEAVSICGGPIIPVQLGRLDSMVPDPEGKLPEETLDASGLKQNFLRKGFSTQELVALSGAHTLGGKGFGNPTVFDNTYYKILLEKPWAASANVSAAMVGLPSDHALPEDEECLRWINKYANDQRSFFEDFKNAYIKLVNSGASWRNV